MEFIENRIKKRIQGNERQIGCWLSMGSHVATEICASAGFDWVLIDMEHAPNDVPQVLSLIHAAAAYDVDIAVRAPWNDAVTIKRLLDQGVQTIVLPNVQTVAEAQEAVRSVRYPPRGYRGVSANSRSNRFGRMNNYFDHADENICLILQIETQLGRENAGKIAAVDGVDCLFVGPQDLAAGVGHLGNPSAKGAKDAMLDVITTTVEAGCAAGILAFNEQDAKNWLAAGASFVAVTGDTFLLARSTEAVVKSFKWEG